MLSATEQLFYIGEFKRDIGRTSMVALPGVGGVLHFPKEGIHLWSTEAASGADRAVTGHGAADIRHFIL